MFEIVEDDDESVEFDEHVTFGPHRFPGDLLASEELYDDEDELYELEQAAAAAGGLGGLGEGVHLRYLPPTDSELSSTQSEQEKRASTAPARPLTDLEEFKRSYDYTLLENAAYAAVQLIERQDRKYDLDSFEGQISCKKFLKYVENMCLAFGISCANRGYRSKFSRAYRVLYTEGSLCYLTEILDSAQEGFPYLYVNGEKYVFSREVLESGRVLFESFCELQHDIRALYDSLREEAQRVNLKEVTEDLSFALQQFDQHWVNFEQQYVEQLMLIESDARRFITNAIKLEKELRSLEIRERARGKVLFESQEYNRTRAELIAICGKINSVANPEGKGRDDLALDILQAAEGISRRISSTQSKAVRQLANKIRKAF